MGFHINILYGNDRITPLLDWLYIGGVENNVRRTLPYADVWINFSHESKKEKQIHEKRKTNIIYYPLRFDDGDLQKGQEMWLRAFELIQQHKGQKILISCSEGVSRSAVMCLWLLCEEFMDYEKAITHLKENRKVFIDKGFHPFVEYLQEIYSVKERFESMYKVIGTKELVDKDGNKVSCEVREFEGMTDEEIEDMMQEMTVTNEKGEKETIDLRYL
ncbi:dual specificity protein phosphatase family protein [Bacillus sp. M6-12]|uniref:dual specificity protein phosphatase family protein n=1 Tax=Bacillus sp. M6-12 TaxID=2054166 RepID=UPI0015E0CD87|nr:dual specificity protein phosphatase family protein [Bacillus sp. M6-12]